MWHDQHSVKNTDAGCKGDRLNPLQTLTVTAVKTAECLTSFWLLFDQDSFYLFGQSISFAEIINFNTVCVSGKYSQVQYLSPSNVFNCTKCKKPNTKSRLAHPNS